MKNLFKIATVAALLTFSANNVMAADKIGFVDPTYVLQNHPAMVEAAQKVEAVLAEIKKKFEAEEKKLGEEDVALSNEYKKIEDDAKKLHQEQASLEVSLKKKIEALDKEAPRLRSKDIQARQSAIQAEQKAFQAKVDALQKRENDFHAKLEAFQAKVAQFQQKVEQEQQANTIDTSETQKVAVNDINEAIKAVADQKGYTVVLPVSTALYAKEGKSADLTDAVLNEVKAKAKPAQAK